MSIRNMSLVFYSVLESVWVIYTVPRKLPFLPLSDLEVIF